MQLEAVIDAVCSEFGCNKEQVITKGRKKNKAREVAIHLARGLSGLSCKDLGLYFGGVSGALVTIMHKRIAQQAAQNRRFRKKLEKIKEQIFNIQDATHLTCTSKSQVSQVQYKKTKGTGNASEAKTSLAAGGRIFFHIPGWLDTACAHPSSP